MIFKIKKQLHLLKIFLFFFLGFLLLITNNSIIAMNNLINEEIQEITTNEEIPEITEKAENEEKIISVEKFCALHEMGHAVVAYELSRRHGTSLINLTEIELIQNFGHISDGTTDFTFDKAHPFGNLFALSGFYGGLEAEKTIKIPIEKFEKKGNHDEQDIEKIVQHIIAKGWFLEDFYSSTDSLEIRKDKIKNIAQRKAQEIIKQYEKFLSPLADELLQKQNITKEEFEDLLEKLINKKNNSPQNTQTKIINQSQYNIQNYKCNCFIL
ncbi:MAG: putative secreted protein, SAP55-like [Candidatus Phytoplasma citri]|nr:MAG: putative secreted protein, SAP55-like [Candidatus Phytoplasma aurantifolia]